MSDEQLREREKGLRLNTNELFFLREGYEEGYEAAWIQRDAEVQALREAVLELIECAEEASDRLKPPSGSLDFAIFQARRAIGEEGTNRAD